MVGTRVYSALDGVVSGAVGTVLGGGVGGTLGGGVAVVARKGTELLPWVLEVEEGKARSAECRRCCRACNKQMKRRGSKRHGGLQ